MPSESAAEVASTIQVLNQGMRVWYQKKNGEYQCGVVGDVAAAEDRVNILVSSGSGEGERWETIAVKTRLVLTKEPRRDADEIHVRDVRVFDSCGTV